MGKRRQKDCEIQVMDESEQCSPDSRTDARTDSQTVVHAQDLHRFSQMGSQHIWKMWTRSSIPNQELIYEGKISFPQWSVIR